MAYISTIHINSTDYELKDAGARTLLADVYTKAEADAAIADAVGEITGVSFEVVTDLPSTGTAGTIYLLSNGGANPNSYDEYIYVSDSWEKIGTTDVDLSGYALKSELGKLAAKDSASGTFTPSGKVTVNSYTPEGTVSAPAITVNPSTTTVNSITAVGTLPAWSASVTNEVLSFTWNTGTLPTKGSNTSVLTGVEATAAEPAFTGTAKAPTGSFAGTSASVTVS